MHGSQTRNRILCASMAIMFCLTVLPIVSNNAKACFGFRIDCEGVTTGWQYDSGAVDVQYWPLNPVPNAISLGGSQHTYIVHVTYGPGCGNQYSSKFFVIEKTLLPGWTYTVTSGSGGSINGVLTDCTFQNNSLVYLSQSARYP